ncbi:helix-turn-helix domain-containing protein [Streptomyces sp. CBMA29]|uniref:helix-turn-helix domain-containing protein n=1 Tax=Streptomyces sp. CBMA29 TaxID=1896314 RepID=UPI001661E1A6|nr:helix-turn-helix domain-containing protein [Streptomyces sp. CBMA29]MBD0739052.1 AraC family transcriptional regulator [Streptomyces sp. CBMA29]
MTTYSAVRTTGIYCRPGCGAKPLAENVRTFELAAAAEAAGYRACLRCRPYRVAGPIAADAPELVCRAVRLVIDGTLDRGNETELAARLAVSSRHLRRLFQQHLGVTPDQLARSRRAHFARRLLDDSELTMVDVAFASGFGSLRQFNRDMRQVFRASPRDLRERRRKGDRLAADGGLSMRLPCQESYDWDAVVGCLAERAVPGVESVEGRTYRRTISLDGGAGVLELGPGTAHSGAERPGAVTHLLLRAHLPFWEGLIHVVERVERMVGTGVTGVSHTGVDTDTDTDTVPGAWGPLETAVQTVLAHDSGTAAEAARRTGALAHHLGRPVPGLTHGLDRLFPSADVLAAADYAPTGLPESAVETVTALARAVTAGEVILDGGAEPGSLVASLTRVPGLAPAAARTIAHRLGARPRQAALHP